jgi:peptidyl-prolyl cis-trans isomerase C
MPASINGIALQRPARRWTPTPCASAPAANCCARPPSLAGLLAATTHAPEAGALSDAASDAIERLLDLELSAARAVGRRVPASPRRARRPTIAVGERVHARHVLFAVTPGVDVHALSQRAEACLLDLRGRKDGEADRFPGVAAQTSNCPSAAEGGDLGWLAPRGLRARVRARAVRPARGGRAAAPGAQPISACTWWKCWRASPARVPAFETWRRRGQRLQQQSFTTALRQYMQPAGGAGHSRGRRARTGRLAPGSVKKRPACPTSCCCGCAISRTTIFRSTSSASRTAGGPGPAPQDAVHRLQRLAPGALPADRRRAGRAVPGAQRGRFRAALRPVAPGCTAPWPPSNSPCSTCKVERIIVCGHSHCGAIRARTKAHPTSPSRTKAWLSLADEALLPVASPGPEVLHRTEQRAVVLQLERLMDYPMVRRSVEAGQLTLHGWHYVIERRTRCTCSTPRSAPSYAASVVGARRHRALRALRRRRRRCGRSAHLHRLPLAIERNEARQLAAAHVRPPCAPAHWPPQAGRPAPAALPDKAAANTSTQGWSNTVASAASDSKFRQLRGILVDAHQAARVRPTRRPRSARAVRGWRVPAAWRRQRPAAGAGAGSAGVRPAAVRRSW